MLSCKSSIINAIGKVIGLTWLPQIGGDMQEIGFALEESAFLTYEPLSPES
jgi:hypothetical protein